MEHGDDELESSPAPLPPHERAWRHPSEVGSWNAELHETLISPPPLSRRLSLFTTTVAGAIALAIVVITVPRGVGTETASDTTIASSKNQQPQSTTVPMRQRNTSIATSAVRVGTLGIYVAATEGLPGDHQVGESIAIVTESTKQMNATIVAVDATTGLTLLSTGQVAATSASPAVSLPSVGTPSRDLPISMIVTEVATGVRHDVTLGVAMAGNVRVVPLDGAQNLEGIGVVRDEQGAFVGVAIRHHHATKLVPTDTIDVLITTVLGTSVSP